MMNNLKSIVIIFMVIFIFGCSRQKVADSYCPFGVCMGDDPAIFYPDKEIRENNITNNKGYISEFEPPIKPNFLSKLRDERSSSVEIPGNPNIYKDAVHYNAEFSIDTGVCSVWVNVVLYDQSYNNPSYNEKVAVFVKEILNDVRKETGIKPDEIKIGEKSTSINWFRDSVKKLNNVSNINISHSNISSTNKTSESLDDFDPFGWVSLKYLFDNYSVCNSDFENIR